MSFSYARQDAPPAPGRADQPAAPPPAPGQASEGVSPARERQADGGLFSGIVPFLVFIPIILIALFSGRSQQKKQKELESKLKTGDQVVTQSGLVGKLTEKGERYVRVELAPGVKVKMLKTAVVGLDAGDEPAKAVVAAK